MFVRIWIRRRKLLESSLHEALHYVNSFPDLSVLLELKQFHERVSKIENLY